MLCTCQLIKLLGMQSINEGGAKAYLQTRTQPKTKVNREKKSGFLSERLKETQV